MLLALGHDANGQLPSQKLAIMQQLLQAVSRSRTHNLPVLLAVAAKSRLIQNGLSTSSGSSTWPARLSAASMRVVASCRDLSLLFCTAQIYLKIHGCCASSTGALVLVIAPLVRAGENWLFHCKSNVPVLHLHAVVYQLWYLPTKFTPPTQHTLLQLQIVYAIHIYPMHHLWLCTLAYVHVTWACTYTTTKCIPKVCNAICKIMFILQVMLQWQAGWWRCYYTGAASRV